MDCFLWFVWPPPKGRSRCNRKTHSRIVKCKGAAFKGSAGQYTQRLAAVGATGAKPCIDAAGYSWCMLALPAVFIAGRKLG